MGKYEGNAEWEDVAPFPQDDVVPKPLATISYPDAYVEATGYLRAIMAANEMSPRVLNLTADIINMNPAHYTVWFVQATFWCIQSLTQGRIYRAQTLRKLKSDLHAELQWLAPLSLKHLKNYQIWHHRQSVIDSLGSWEGEYAFIDEMMQKDAKNYHVWSYRQWATKRFNLWDDADEMGYVEKLLVEDIRNNSAWNHRWYLVFGRPHGEPFANKNVVDREVAFAEKAIRLAPQNESPWSYLRALYSKAYGSAALKDSELASFAREFAGLDGGEVRSSHALDVIAWVCGREKGGEQEAVKALDMLAEKYDPVRANYWRYRKAMVNSGQEAAAATTAAS
jgi:protein farnesyltransferase/geranylgeranyltransferase type-1 subunit alpha